MESDALEAVLRLSFPREDRFIVARDILKIAIEQGGRIKFIDLQNKGIIKFNSSGAGKYYPGKVSRVWKSLHKAGFLKRKGPVRGKYALSVLSLEFGETLKRAGKTIEEVALPCQA